MQLSSLEIPISFYGISKQYGNTHWWMEVDYVDISGGGSTGTVHRVFTIPEGNYNALDFIAKWNEAISPRNAVTPNVLIDPTDPFAYLFLTLDITATGSGTGKVTIGPALDISGGTIEISRLKMDFARNLQGHPDNVDVSSRVGWNLGFTKKSYDGNVRYVADTIIEPATIRYVYLAVDDFNNSANNHFMTAFNQSILSPNILARISMRGNYFSLLMDNDLNIVTEPRKYFGPVDIQRLRIRLFDDFGRVLDMNGANFSFCLTFTTLYDL
jgi:hypothetical protein